MKEHSFVEVLLTWALWEGAESGTVCCNSFVVLSGLPLRCEHCAIQKTHSAGNATYFNNGVKSHIAPSSILQKQHKTHKHKQY